MGLAYDGYVVRSVPCVCTSGGHFGVRWSSRLFLFYCTNMFWCSTRLCTGLLCCWGSLLGSEPWRTHCMAEFFAGAVPAVSRTPDSCHLDWMIDAVACGLSSSSWASSLWVERHSVPWGLSSSFLGWRDWLDDSLRRMGCPTTAAQDQWQVQGLGIVAVGLCFPVPPACSAALGSSTVPIGSRTYSFHGLVVVWLCLC